MKIIYLGMDTMFSGVLSTCMMRLVMYVCMFTTYVNNYFLALYLSGQFWELYKVHHDKLGFWESGQ